MAWTKKFLKKKNSTRSHVIDQHVVVRQKDIKLGPVVSDRIVFETRIVKFVFFNIFFVQCCHILKKKWTYRKFRNPSSCVKSRQIWLHSFFFLSYGVEREICKCVCSVAIFLDFLKNTRTSRPRPLCGYFRGLTFFSRSGLCQNLDF